MTQGTQGPAAPPAGGAADPSMEDILASIRRILSDDEQPATAQPAPAQPAPAEPVRMAPPAVPQAMADEPSDVLDLNESMLVQPPAPSASLDDDDFNPPPLAPPPPVIVQEAPPIVLPPPASAPMGDRLVAPEAEESAASSLGALMRTLAEGRDSVPVYRGGPTIEDVVREEIRPLLKLWLDANLPPLVERLVRAEIERVAGRVQR